MCNASVFQFLLERDMSCLKLRLRSFCLCASWTEPDTLHKVIAEVLWTVEYLSQFLFLANLSLCLRLDMQHSYRSNLKSRSLTHSNACFLKPLTKQDISLTQSVCCINANELAAVSRILSSAVEQVLCSHFVLVFMFSWNSVWPVLSWR